MFIFILIFIQNVIFMKCYVIFMIRVDRTFILVWRRDVIRLRRAPASEERFVFIHSKHFSHYKP